MTYYLKVFMETSVPSLQKFLAPVGNSLPFMSVGNTQLLNTEKNLYS